MILTLVEHSMLAATSEHVNCGWSAGNSRGYDHNLSIAHDERYLILLVERKIALGKLNYRFTYNATQGVPVYRHLIILAADEKNIAHTRGDWVGMSAARSASVFEPKQQYEQRARVLCERLAV